jgi:hypothetical protein
MAKLGICAAFLLTAVGGSGAVDAWAADVMPIKVPLAPMDFTGAPRPCTDPADFISTNCELTWHGITVFGILTRGSAGKATVCRLTRPMILCRILIPDPETEQVVASDRAPNALSNSTIGIKGTEPIGGNVSLVFDLDAGFDPYSLRYSNDAGSVGASRGIPQNLQGA